ncbi:MAG: aspartate/glutamate racemase family protein [Novosphingobium sp.]|nr:aspartate/glutamate racemase family protein [Novosphingobium sp.]
MALKVFVQHIWPAPENDQMVGPEMKITYDAQLQMLHDILGKYAEVHVAHNEKSSYFSNCFSIDAYNKVGLLDSLAEAEKMGCDVALIACGNDPALQEARDMLSIPVVAPTEAGIHVACQLGQRFGIITMDSPSVAIVERNLRMYALGDRAVTHRPVRSPGFYEGGTKWFADESYLREQVIPKFEEVARGLIEDGADVIVTACGNYSAFSYHGYSQITGTSVPVVDAFTAGTYMAKLMGEYHQRYGLKTSKQGAYAGTSPEAAAFALACVRGEMKREDIPAAAE